MKTNLEVGVSVLEARIKAALVLAGQKRLSGDLQGARELALSVLAIDEEQLEARRLLAELLDEFELSSAHREPEAPPAPEAPAWPSVVAPPEASSPPVETRSGMSRNGARHVAAQSPPPRASRARMVAIVGGVAAVAAVALLLGTATFRRTDPEVAPLASPSLSTPGPAAVHTVAGPPAPPKDQAPARPLNPEILRNAEALLARGNYAEAQRAVNDGLRLDPSEPGLRALQRRIQTDAQRAATAAATGVGEARSAAEKARAAELAARPFQQARELEAEAARLYTRQLWTESLAKGDEAVRAYQEAQVLAQVESARLEYEQSRARAAEAGAETLAPRPFGEAVTRASRAQTARDRKEFEAAASEFGWAAATMEQARRAAVDAAAAQPATPAASAGTQDEDRAAILAVIKGYTAAMQAKDLAALKALWPSLGGAQETKVRSGFEFAKSVRVQIDVIGVQIANGTATVACRRTDTVVTLEGRTVKSDRTAAIRLVKNNSGWSIAAIQ